eukprot:365996-Chlamydomonas_euryale.AAC.10
MRTCVAQGGYRTQPRAVKQSGSALVGLHKGLPGGCTKGCRVGAPRVPVYACPFPRPCPQPLPHSQAKRIDNTSVRDEPYTFTIGAHDAIGAFEEAVIGMKVGGIRRVEVRQRQPLSIKTKAPPTACRASRT